MIVEILSSLCFLFRISFRTRITNATRTPANKLENLIDQNHGQSHSQHQQPLVQAERHNAEYLSKKRNIQDQEVQTERDRHCQKQPWVDPWRCKSQRTFLIPTEFFVF
ncbi:hypothetical protein ABFX02_04G187200 [Erythranthe guttata]